MIIRYFIKRPVGTLLIFFSLTILGLVLAFEIPTSLLPDVDVPKIIIKVDRQNTSAAEVEEMILKPIKDAFIGLDGLVDLESKASNHLGLIDLTFQNNNNMSLSIIEVNEKIDRILPNLPKDLSRPLITRLNISDIPIVHLQLIPKKETNFLQSSKLIEKVIKRRIEQVQGVSWVDINGIQQIEISIYPNYSKMAALGVYESDIINVISNANSDLREISFKEGQYRYTLNVENEFSNLDKLEDHPLRLKDGTVVKLNEVVKINMEEKDATGFHLYKDKKAVVLRVLKQPESQIVDVITDLNKTLLQLEKEYPAIEIIGTQDQTFLLNAGIENLKQDLIYGGLLTIFLLFLFLGDWASPALMAITIPLSLVFTFIFFYIFNISFNIISLSGLTLGIGMLIDNSIVVIDNINRKRLAGYSESKSAELGTREVIVPVISQVLTTVVVYGPLLYLSGVAGDLVLDQGIALTVSLSVSLIIAFILLPVLYSKFLSSSIGKIKKEPFLYLWILEKYHKLIYLVLKHKAIYLIGCLIFVSIGMVLFFHIPVAALPKIERNESVVKVDWNMPLDVNENLRLTRNLILQISKFSENIEADIGIKQFLNEHGNLTAEQAEIYFKCKNEVERIKADSLIENWFTLNFPNSIISISASSNALNQVLLSNKEFLEVRINSLKKSGERIKDSELNDVLKFFSDIKFKYGDGFAIQKNYNLTLNYSLMSLYGIEKNMLEKSLQQQFGTYKVSEFKEFDNITLIALKSDSKSLTQKLSTKIRGKNNAMYPISLFCTLNVSSTEKYITGDKNGLFRSIFLSKEDLKKNPDQLLHNLRKFSSMNNLNINFHGSYFDNKILINQMIVIVGIVLLLLFVILAIQYENFIQPIIVMLSIPIGLSASIIALWISSGTIDIMAGVGFIVVLGLIVDDPILKIETLNRLKKEHLRKGNLLNKESIEKMIHEAGNICLKPLLMVSLTTSIALVPVFFYGGIGNELQRPLAIIIIGGLTLGTFFTLCFTPIIYFYVSTFENRKYE